MFRKLTHRLVQPQTGTPKTSSLSSPISPPRALAQDSSQDLFARQASYPSSPLSSSATADDGESSPLLPPLPVPQLPERALEFLRTPPRSNRGTDEDQYYTTSWGSPYPPADRHHLRRLSFSSSEASDELPSLQLEIDTPFLRPTPIVSNPEPAHLQPNPNLSGTAAVLVNRVRRPLGGIKEEWIRQHTTHDPGSEQRHWLSDGTDDSGNSSLRGSVASNDAAWFEEKDPVTPRPASQPVRVSGSPLRHPRNRTSNETLRQEGLNHPTADESDNMDSPHLEKTSGQDAASIDTKDSNSDVTPRPATPPKHEKKDANLPTHVSGMEPALPATPPKPTKAIFAQTPRLKKKVPWKGKNILVLIPRDEERGQPGKAPVPLDSTNVDSILRYWEQRGYNVQGFDLDDAHGSQGTCDNKSRSRDEWPSLDDIAEDRALRKYNVTLPDLNAWKDYVNELAEAKLRALGVTFAEEEPTHTYQEAISTVPSSNMSRQTSSQFPSYPFSPPLPTGSATSNGAQGFPFTTTFLPGGLSATHSPGISATASPVSFHPQGPGRFNSRASISISPHEMQFHPSGQPSPGWSPQLFLQQQQHGRSGSPSMLNMVSPGSPFSPDGMSPSIGLHHRHQSLQHPMLPHQLIHRIDSARASPRLQELREDEEEDTQTNPYFESPTKTSEAFIQHNATNSRQKEIHEAQYHLEEQFRSQLEHDDYSPHNEATSAPYNAPVDNFTTAESLHERGPSVHFRATDTGMPQNRQTSGSLDGPSLHHPQPHSRGHSLSQSPFFDSEEQRDSTDEGSSRKALTDTIQATQTGKSYVVGTTLSNFGTPAHSVASVNQPQQRSLSIASNPWADSNPLANDQMHSRQGSHNRKPSNSKLNAGAAEFKFNPKSSFTPGQFVFNGKNPQASSFTPMAFHQQSFPIVSAVPVVPAPTLPSTSSHFSVPSTTSSINTMTKINPTAPVFSPHKSEFSFSSSGPRFNPDAQAFRPLASLAPSLNSVGASGNESSDIRPKPIFGNIKTDYSQTAQHVKAPGKKSKAVPVLPPSRRPSSSDITSKNDATNVKEAVLEGGASRAKKQFRDGDSGDGDDVPQFAEPTREPELHLIPDLEALDLIFSRRNSIDSTVAVARVRDDEDETVNAADTTLASTVISESTDGKLPSESNDTKTTTSPSATSPDPDKAGWRPMALSNEPEVHEFNNPKLFFSPAAKPFVPGGFQFGAPEMGNTPFEPDFTTQPEHLAEPLSNSEEDRAGSPTPGPDYPPATRVAEAEEPRESRSASPEQAPISSRGLMSSRFASPPPISKGLRSSRFASSPSLSPKSSRQADIQEVRVDGRRDTPDEGSDGMHGAGVMTSSSVSDKQLASVTEPEDKSGAHSYEPLPVSPPSNAGIQQDDDATRELTFEEIDAVMQQINENDPTMGVKRTVDSPERQLSSHVRKTTVASIIDAPPHLPSPVPFRSEAPSPSPRQYRSLPQEHVRSKPSAELDDPFIDPPRSALSQSFDATVQRLNAGDDLPESEWDDTFSASEQGKLAQRVHYFDHRVNDLVDNVLASRLEPLENNLVTIQHLLGKLSQRAQSIRRDGRNISPELQESDADDEDEEPMRRSMSPRKDKKVDQIRHVFTDVLNQLQAEEKLTVAKSLEDMKLQMAEDLRSVVEEAVKNNLLPPPAPGMEDDSEVNEKLSELQAKKHQLEELLRGEELRSQAARAYAQQLEEKLRLGESRVEAETATRRAAEDRAAELRRQLEQAETKVEVEIMNRSVFDQRTHDLEERLKAQEAKTELELSGRRGAEDRLSEVQRLLRISSEEENRLRDVLEQRDQKIMGIEQSFGNASMRLTQLEANTVELKNRLNIADADLRDARQEARQWRSEAEQASDSATRQAHDFVQSVNENKHLHKLIDTLSVQLTENERIRDNWRTRFVSLQDDMAHAAREITEENSQRTKKEQALIARQEVLDARLQAEARTRERLEVEVERLEKGERAGMRAVSECNRLEGLLVDLRNENHHLHQQVFRSQREAQEAREAASSESQRGQLEIQEAKDLAAAQVQRAQQEVEEAMQLAAIETQQVREAVAVELEAARNQVNIVKADSEEEIAKLRAELDQVRMDADTANAHHEMMLEEAQNTREAELEALQYAKATELGDISRRHQNELEDLQARYERQMNSAAEDAQRVERNLLERLSLSTSKTQHLHDRIAHLEEKVQIAQEAAKAAAQAAQASRGIAMPELSTHSGPVGQTKQLAQAMQLPEKISPQALRESIMVLQEQLQAREQRIEELEQTVADLDPEAATKISKRDDEITWLRELLAVRHGDLQDIIAALSAERYDREAVKGAAIRLKANLQMEEQERERAMNGGSALNLPNIAATFSKAATPRVAQAVGPLAAAWGNWRRSNQASLNLSGVMSSPGPGKNATPSKSNSVNSQNSLLLGLMTPPASNIRDTPQAGPSQLQPTAFGTTGRRYTAEQFANRARGSPTTARQAEKMPFASTPPPRQERKEPRTPPMMQPHSYDDDARMEEFDHASFFDD